MSKWGGLLLLFLVSLALGYYGSDTGDRSGQFQLSSEMAFSKVYTQLPCPGITEMQALLDKVHFVYETKDLSCQNELFSRLVKTLAYAQQLKFNFPRSWPVNFKNEISDLLNYVSQNSAKMEFDLTQVDSLAYNKIQTKEISLGQRMFEDEPLEVLSVLYHEARHSVESAPAHAFCLKGELNNYPGACDQVFTLNPKEAGAYTYSVMFYLAVALYSENTTEGQREWALTAALMMLSSRFNEIHDSLAEYEDILALVDEHQQIYLYDIKRNRITPLKYKAPAGEKVTRIEFAVATGGPLFFTDKGRMYTWSFYDKAKKLEPFMKKSVPEAGIFPLFSNRVYVPYYEGTLHLVYGKNSKLMYNIYDPLQSKSVLRPYERANVKDEKQAVPNIKIFFQSLSTDNALLDQNGKIYFAPHYANEELFQTRPELNREIWRQGTGGVYSDGLYLISEQGRIHSFRNEFVPSQSEEGFDERVVAENPEWRAVPAGLRQYVQGFSYEAFLAEDDTVYVQARNTSPGQAREAPLQLKKPGLKNLIMLRRVKTRLVDQAEH